jgi:hypothetical protein
LIFDKTLAVALEADTSLIAGSIPAVPNPSPEKKHE